MLYEDNEKIQFEHYVTYAHRATVLPLRTTPRKTWSGRGTQLMEVLREHRHRKLLRPVPINWKSGKTSDITKLVKDCFIPMIYGYTVQLSKISFV